MDSARRAAARWALAAACLAAWPATGTASVILDFEDVASLDLVQSFETQGFSVVGDPFGVFILNQSLGGCTPPVCADNGSYYLRTQAGGVRIARTDFGLFDLLGFDVAEAMILGDAFPSPYPRIQVTGFHADGSRVEASFELDGIIDGQGGNADFESIDLGSEFSDLSAVQFLGVRTEIPLNTEFFALDRLRIVPEPGTAVLLLLGLVGISLEGTRRERGRDSITPG